MFLSQHDYLSWSTTVQHRKLQWLSLAKTERKSHGRLANATKHATFQVSASYQALTGMILGIDLPSYNPRRPSMQRLKANHSVTISGSRGSVTAEVSKEVIEEPDAGRENLTP